MDKHNSEQFLFKEIFFKTMQKLTAVTVYKRHIMVVVLLYILLVNNNLFLSVTSKMFRGFLFINTFKKSGKILIHHNDT